MAVKPVYNKYGYEKQSSINNRYADQLKAYEAEQNKLAEQQRAATNKQYDKAQNQNYVQYMMNQKNLPAQLARLGITGGAAESSQLRANTNYENMKNATENERGTALGNINQTLANSISNYKTTQTAAQNAALAESAAKTATAKQAEKERQQELKRQKRETLRKEYAETVRRYNTIKKVDKALARARKNKAPQWQIQLLQAQRADLELAGQKSGGSSSGGSGGGRSRRSYSYSSGSSGGSSGSGSGSGKSGKSGTGSKSGKSGKSGKSSSKGVPKRSKASPSKFPVSGKYGGKGKIEKWLGKFF